jgi:hypothetical protein
VIFAIPNSVATMFIILHTLSISLDPSRLKAWDLRIPYRGTLNHWTFEQIVECSGLSELQCIKHLAHLDRLKMIELLPRNRIKLLLAPNFQWRENGPIQQFFLRKLQSDFFNSRFNKEQENLIVINGMLAQSSVSVFKRKMEHLAKEFDELSSDDAGLPFDERNGTTVVLAMRPWQVGMFSQFDKILSK